MFCQKCGKEIADDAGFCKFCGEKVVKDKMQEQGSQGTKSEKKISGKIVLGIVTGVIVLIVAVAVCIMFFHSQDRENKNGENLAETEQAGTNLQLYNVTQDSIDVYAQNRQSNARDFSLTWDKTLFYLLEDVTPEDTDGQIEKYDIARKELTNAQNGNQISYEIYTNPETGKMNKIVSIEDQGNTLEITDYYYQDNGQPNFIYQRTDSIYTPTYATPDKTGERFYFNNDTLVRWRWINAPLQVEEIALTEDAQSSAQTQYIFNDLDAGKQDEYNQKETQMLNAAYNTYEAMEKSSDHANVKGYVLDTIGNPVKDASVEFYAGEDAIGSVATDENGYYETGISLYNAGYDLTISCKGYADATIYGAVADKANVTNWMENVYLTPKVKQECSVQLNIYDADTTTQNEDETVSKTGIANASVVVRSGVNNTSGKSVAKADSDSNGMVTLNLNVGVYTIEISVNGYISSYETLTVDADKTVEIPLTEEISGNQMKVVLTWDGNEDLDACLFTPYKAESGDMAHINAVNSADDYGNALASDSKNGQAAEVITIGDSTNGTYKYYVSDYNNCLNGNLTATDMLGLNVRVTVYDKNGIVATYTLPHDQSGVIWEVFEIKNGKVVTLQNTYKNLDGKSWWSEDKEDLDIEQCDELKEALGDIASWNWLIIRGENSEEETSLDDSAIDVIKENPLELYDFISYSINNGRKLSCVPYSESPHAGNFVGETSVELLNMIYNSLTGEQYDYTREVGKDTGSNMYVWNEGYLLYEGADGLGWADYLKNYSVKRNKTGEWEVMVEYWGSYEFAQPQDQRVMNVTFTLVKNPDSIFNGYSIRDMRATIADTYIVPE